MRCVIIHSMSTKEYWLRKILSEVNINSSKYTLDDVIKVLSKDKYNLAKDLGISYGSSANLSKKLAPNKQKGDKLTNFLLLSKGLKYCNSCKQVKGLVDFNTNNSNKDGLSGQCSLCHRSAQNTYYKNNSKAQQMRVRIIFIVGILS